MGMKSMHSEVAKLDFRKGRGKSCFCVGRSLGIYQEKHSDVI